MNVLHFGTEGLVIEEALQRLPPFSFLQHVELFDVPNKCPDYTCEPGMMDALLMKLSLKSSLRIRREPIGMRHVGQAYLNFFV